MRIGRPLWHEQRGFTYLGIFILLVVIGIEMAAVGEVWETSVRREKEGDLLLAGREIRDAIDRYHAAGVGSGNRYHRERFDRTGHSERLHVTAVHADNLLSRQGKGEKALRYFRTETAPIGAVSCARSRLLSRRSVPG